MLLLFGLISYLLALFFEVSRKMSGPFDNKSKEDSFTKLFGSFNSWFLYAYLFSISIFTITEFIFPNILFMKINYLIVLLLFLVLFIKPRLFKKINHKEAEALGGIMIIYSYLLIILGGLINA